MNNAANSKANSAVVLISGGLDSATCLAIAKQQGYDCYGLSFNYGQRSISELRAASHVAQSQAVKEHRVINLDIGALGGSALTDKNLDVPQQQTTGIPITYVPARNTIFLSYGLAWAEVLDAQAIFIGVNSLDYSGYPDCRAEFITAFQRMADLATKAGVEGLGTEIKTPLISLTKAEIIDLGMTLSVDYEATVSCYQANEDGQACGSCDSCRFRRRGFVEAGVCDPTRYV